MWSFNKKNEKLLKVIAPHNGKIQLLESLNDGVFSKKIMGDGLVITSDLMIKKINVLAPISGKLITVFPTKHAFGIKSSEGKEILVHIGIDTVKLKGKGFKTYVKQNEIVKVGQKLVTVNLDLLRKNSFLESTILIVTSGQKIKKQVTGKIESKNILFRI